MFYLLILLSGLLEWQNLLDYKFFTGKLIPILVFKLGLADPFVSQYKFFTLRVTDGFYWSLSDCKFLQFSRTLLSNLTDLSSAVVLMVSIFFRIISSSSFFSRLFGIFHSAPTTLGTTVTFIFYNFFGSHVIIYPGFAFHYSVVSCCGNFNSRIYSFLRVDSNQELSPGRNWVVDLYPRELFFNYLLYNLQDHGYYLARQKPWKYLTFGYQVPRLLVSRFKYLDNKVLRLFVSKFKYLDHKVPRLLVSKFKYLDNRILSKYLNLLTNSLSDF